MNRKKLTKIGIVPTIRVVYENQFEYSFDLKLFDLFKKIFNNFSITVLDKNSNLQRIDFIVFLGGNTLTAFSKKKIDKIRSEIDFKILKKGIKYKKPILGICHGMQVIAKYFGAKIVKKKHLGDHKILLIHNKKQKKEKVNSYHNYIVQDLSKDFKILAKAEDKSCEAMLHKKKRILGIMWHPERYKKIKIFDVNFIKKYLCN